MRPRATSTSSPRSRRSSSAGSASSAAAGSALGAIAGAFVLTILTNVLFFAGIDPLYQSFFQGLFLVVAVLLGAVLGRLLRGSA